MKETVSPDESPGPPVTAWIKKTFPHKVVSIMNLFFYAAYLGAAAIMTPLIIAPLAAVGITWATKKNRNCLVTCVIWALLLIPVMFFDICFVKTSGTEVIRYLVIIGLIGEIAYFWGLPALILFFSQLFVAGMFTFGVINFMYLPIGIVLCLVLMYLTRGYKLSILAPVRVSVFQYFAAVMIFLTWYTQPIRPVELDGSPAIKHLKALEKAVRGDGPRTNRYYSIYEDCNGERLYMTNLMRPGIVEFNRKTGEVLRRDEFNGFVETILFECSEEKIYAGEYNTGKLFIFNGRNLDSPRIELPLGITSPVRIFHKEGDDIFFYYGDGHFSSMYPVTIIDSSGAILYEFDGEDIGIEIEEIIPLGNRTFLTGSGRSIKLLKYNDEIKGIETLREVNVRLFPAEEAPLPPIMHFQHDSENNIVYVSEFRTGLIHRLEIPRMAISPLVMLAPGIRHICFAPKYGFLAAGNYIKGRISIIDVDSKEIVYEQNIGAQVRGVTLSSDGERIFVVSKGGFFEIDLSRILQ